ncbi:MAG TPA: hypothetical protein V6C69_08890 [Trichormus sp.]
MLQEHVSEKELKLLVCERGVRIQAVRGSWVMISTAPDWDAILFSRYDKTICRVPYKNWSKTGFRVINVDDAEVEMPKLHAANAGHDTVSPYGTLSVTTNSWKGSSASSVDMMFQSRGGPSKCEFQLETTSAINTSPQVMQLLHQLYRIPELGEFPIQFSNSLHSRPMLHTLELRRVDVPDSAFIPPSGFKKVNTETAVWINDSDKAKIKDFGEMMDAAH